MKLFGTDGVRGIPGQFPLEDAALERLGRAAAARLAPDADPARPVLFARDTRGSGPRLLRAVARGVAAGGVSRLVDLGVLPTPALVHLAPERGAVFGVVVSASHNPPRFNGIKFFDARGRKLSEAAERGIEEAFETASAASSREPRLVPDPEAARDYLDFLLSTFPADLDLAGVKLVADASNGAASALIGPLLRRLGAAVTVIGDRPDGENINVGCGALDTAAMQKAVAAHKADCGLSLDGDADRVLFSDEKGRLLNGDTLIGMAAAHLKERGALGPHKVAVTVMSNAGLTRFLEERGIASVRVPVGDRNVTEAMEAENLRVGGENSGHIVFRQFGASGDGMLTALQVLAILKSSGKPLSRFRALVPSYPQALAGVPVERKVPLEQLARVQAAVARGERALGGGRVYLRYSGTEPLLRILVEGPKAAAVRRVAAELEAVCREELDHAS